MRHRFLISYTAKKMDFINDFINFIWYFRAENQDDLNLWKLLRFSGYVASFSRVVDFLAHPKILLNINCDCCEMRLLHGFKLNCIIDYWKPLTKCCDAILQISIFNEIKLIKWPLHGLLTVLRESPDAPTKLYYYNKLRQNIGKIKTLDKKRTDMSFKKIVRDLNPWPGVLTKYIARRANHYATELYSFS